PANDPATTASYILSLHDALPICAVDPDDVRRVQSDHEPPRVHGLVSAGAGRDDADLLFVPRARDGAGPRRVGDRGADAPLVRSCRRAEGRSASWVPQAPGRGARGAPAPPEGLRTAAHGERD